MPECCVVCRGEGELGVLRRRREEERLVREIAEMREWLPGVWGGVASFRGGCLDGGVVEGKGWGKEVDDLRVLLERERVEW